VAQAPLKPTAAQRAAAGQALETLYERYPVLAETLHPGWEHPLTGRYITDSSLEEGEEPVEHGGVATPEMLQSLAERFKK